jgi:hypothetical protein
MDRGTKISAIGHAAAILWVLLGDWLWPFDTSAMPEVANVTMMSESEFAALQASAPKADEGGETTPPPPRPKPPAPAEELPAEETPAEDLPVAAEAQPDDAPPPVAPIAEVEQPIPVEPSNTPPAPRPLDRVTAVRVNESPDTPDIADKAIPEVTDEAAAEVIAPETAPAAPQEAAPVVVTEAEPAPEDAPQLAPTASSRPKARPAPKVETPPEQSDADAIAAALAEATAEPAAEPTSTQGSAANIPEGPPMSGGEIEGLRIAINRCWVTSTLSTEAMNTTVTVRVEMSEAGKPTAIEMTSFEGGSRQAADRAFEAGRRAVMRCAGTNGYDLPAEKYGQWNVLNLIFDPNGMRLR